MTDSETDLGGCRKLEMLSAMGKYTQGFPQIDPFCEVTFLETCFVFGYNNIHCELHFLYVKGLEPSGILAFRVSSVMLPNFTAGFR